MSVPKKNTTWGEVLYEDKTYGVLDGFHLNEDIWEKYNQYNDDTEGCFKSTAPWTSAKPTWSIEDDNLYLTGLCKEGLPMELFGSEKILADWVTEMKLLVKHRRVYKTYERRNAYLNKIDTFHLSLDQGNIVDKRRETELYTSLEMKNYIDNEEENEITWSPPYTTLRIESIKLLDYLENKTIQQIEDQVFPVMLNLIEQMIQKGGKDDISLGIKDVKTVLKDGEVAVFASAKGSDIDEMVLSVIYSMTDEILEAKGCLIHLSMNKEYPISGIKSIVNSFESKLGFDKIDSLDIYLPNKSSFIFGTWVSDEMSEDEVLIRVLLSV